MAERRYPASEVRGGTGRRYPTPQAAGQGQRALTLGLHRKQPGRFPLDLRLQAGGFALLLSAFVLAYFHKAESYTWQRIELILERGHNCIEKLRKVKHMLASECIVPVELQFFLFEPQPEIKQKTEDF